ncbi:TonB-dependent receptor [Pelagerythrobacter rhizovicinus]|uniref:TonB-dependent receptor n=1 Tax=Pelagerythrobacter rhizovicinus TaxID=2268576 RepID=A0A4Q2KLC3_9SPHN|nr:TonB-dependent receptor [Pelagerythrobacter rhizovicinus]RXZ64123.1 TonB-dependent receptor [Pelagerythrobacter rhizovicinus]
MRVSNSRMAAVLLGSAAVAAFAAPSASAQDAPDAAVEAGEAGDDAAIVVTARRREERLIDVPVAVTAFTGEQLAERGALDITDVAQSVPNVTLENSRATNSTLSAFIRGIGQQDPVSGFEQGVGIYLDDVYLNRPQAAVLDIYDVERIEVLRGPQGTLYGRNTIGGAVKYVTRQLPQEFAFKARATYGTYDQAEGVITASAPLGDIVRVGGSVARLSRGGFGDNLTLGTENYNKDVWAARGSLEMGGHGEPVFVRISGDYTRDKSLQRGGHRLIPGLVSGAPVLDDVYDTRGALDDPKQDVEAYGLSMNVSVELGDALTFRSISAWRKDDTFGPIDFDALPAVDLDVPGAYFNEQISQEFQFLYDDGGPLTGLLGLYYLDATADTLFDVRLFTTVPGLTAFTAAEVDTETYAIFGDFTYDLTEQLSLSVGGRYTWDERSASILRQNYLGGGSPFFGGAGVAAGAPSTDFDGSAQFKKFTPRASISFMPTPDHNIYASYSKGFKGGGFDPRGVGSTAPAATPGAPTDAEIADFLSFAPEQVDSYEIGYKGSLMGGRLNVAVAGFYADYTDVQIPGSVACTIMAGDPPEPTPSFCGVVSNAGKATFKGLEFEANARLGGGFALAGSLGYIDAQYDEYITNIGNTPTDVADFREVQNTPRWTASGTASYNTGLGDGDLYIGSTVSYRSKTYQFEIPNPYLDQDGYALVDASVVYTAPGGRWSIGLYGKNLTDKQYKTSGYTFVATDPTTGEIQTGANGQPIPTLGPEGTLTAFYGNPRQVFLTATLKY